MSDKEQASGPFGKAQTVDPEVRAHVYSLVTALGGTAADENGTYTLGDDALACLRDLKRWLKLYDEKTNRLDVARCLAEANVIIGDILPILETWKTSSNNDRSKARLALACLELLVPLTWPLETGGEMTVNHHRHTPYLQQAQVRYKAAILAQDKANILQTVVRVGLPSIATSRAERTARDEGIIKLVLYFFRNISVIKPLPNLPSQGLDSEISRSATVEAFRQQDVFALLLTMCSNMGEDFDQQDVVLLDIIFNLIKGVDVNKLFMNDVQIQVQKTLDLKDILGKEKSMHREHAKVAPSRHGRFGTMIWVKREEERMSAVSGQDNLKDSRSSLLKMDKSKKWSKPQQRRKDLDHSIHDFDRQVHLTNDASELLRNFVEEFLDSGFNPLFAHLRKAIEREADRILDINYRQFFYTVSWLLQAERCRRARQEQDKKDRKVQTEFEAESYGLVATVLNQETFITLNRFMQNSLDNKEWQDLNACMKCFTQILLTVQEMARSPLEDDQEIADNIQSRIFYEETTHDRIVTILKSYHDQGLGYLDTCTELSHVFLRMLERYSKENTDLQIRSRRRAQQKKKKKVKEQSNNEPNENEEHQGQEGEAAATEDLNAESENEDLVESAQVSRDRKFDFTRFSAKFTSQSSVDTFVSFAAFYRDLSSSQLKRAHRFFHRVAFKQDLAVLLFRVDIVALFYRMIKGPGALDHHGESFKEWEELVRQVLKKLFRKLEERPELIVEMLFSKIRSTMYYLEYGHDRQTVASTRVPAELEVKPAPGRDVDEQLGIVIAVLVNDDKRALVEWVLEWVTKASDERSAWEAESVARIELAAVEAEQRTEADDSAAPKGTESPIAPSISTHASSYDIRTAIFNNARLKLLMSLSGLERLGSDDKIGANWVFPSSLDSTQLSHTRTTIQKNLDSQWVDGNGGREPEDLLRRVKNTESFPTEDDEVRRDGFNDDSEGSDDLADFMFPANLKEKSNNHADGKEPKKSKKRKLERRKVADDGELEARKKAKEQAAIDKRQKIKSALYINDSDEDMDEEENRAFFTREEENRKKQAHRVAAALNLARTEATTSSTARKRKSTEDEGDRRKKARESRDSEEEGTDLGEDEVMEVDSHSSPAIDEMSDDRSDDEETPPSSQNVAHDVLPGSDNTLKEMSDRQLNITETSGGSAAKTRPETTQKRRSRGGFILDDSDDDE